jgi:hypothetical protein
MISDDGEQPWVLWWPLRDDACHDVPDCILSKREGLRDGNTRFSVRSALVALFGTVLTYYSSVRSWEIEHRAECDQTPGSGRQLDPHVLKL